MLFNSYQFTFGFLPIVLIVFGLLAATDFRRGAAIFLIGASLFFYAYWDWRYLFLFGFSIIFNFLWASRLIPPIDGDGSSVGSRLRLALGIAVNLAILGFFKYRNFVVGSIGAAAGHQWRLPPLVLPLAISFFTFEQITYLKTAYEGEAGTRDFLSYCMFITFFPHLIAGPIVRYQEIYPQFNRETRFTLSAANLSEGLMIFAIGLFKKVIIADYFRVIVNPLFDRVPNLSFFDAWGAALAFSLEIYFDFSGYSDMAIGLARMFGVRFPENFDSPYQSRDVIQFWRKWHITLSFFLRDYLYIPLGGNRRGELRQHLNLFVTMLLGGLWHGASWTFVIWGALHGFFLSINHVWSKSKRTLPSGVGWTLTFILVTIAWVFFRAPDFSRAGMFLRAMAGLSGFGWNVGRRSIGGNELRHIAAGLAIVLFCPNRQRIVAAEWRSDYLYALAFGILAVVSIMSMANPPPFIYFQF